MVEELTEKNLNLTESVQELEQQIEHLNSLNEAADDVEEGHLEYEAQLQAELDSKDIELQETYRQIKEGQSKIEDLEVCFWDAYRLFSV